MTLNTITYRKNRSETLYTRMALTNVHHCQIALRCLYSRNSGNFHEFKMAVAIPPCIIRRHSQNVAVPTSLASIRTSSKFKRPSYALYIRLRNPRGGGGNSQKSLHAEIWLIATFVHFSTDEKYFICPTTTVIPVWLTTVCCISHYIHIPLTRFLWTLLEMSKFANWVSLSFPLSDWSLAMRLISDAPFSSDQ